MSTFAFYLYHALKPTVSKNNSMHCRLHPSGSTCCRIDQQIYISTTNVKHLFNISSSISAFSASNSAFKGKIYNSSLVSGEGFERREKILITGEGPQVFPPFLPDLHLYLPSEKVKMLIDHSAKPHRLFELVDLLLDVHHESPVHLLILEGPFLLLLLPAKCK